MACITAGTSRLVLGRQAGTSASQAPGSSLSTGAELKLVSGSPVAVPT